MEGRGGVEENQEFSSIRGRIRALYAQWIGAVRPFFAYRQKEGE